MGNFFFTQKQEGKSANVSDQFEKIPSNLRHFFEGQTIGKEDIFFIEAEFNLIKEMDFSQFAVLKKNCICILLLVFRSENFEDLSELLKSKLIIKKNILLEFIASTKNEKLLEKLFSNEEIREITRTDHEAIEGAIKNEQYDIIKILLKYPYNFSYVTGQEDYDDDENIENLLKETVLSYLNNDLNKLQDSNYEQDLSDIALMGYYILRYLIKQLPENKFDQLKKHLDDLYNAENIKEIIVLNHSIKNIKNEGHYFNEDKELFKLVKENEILIKNQSERFNDPNKIDFLQKMSVINENFKNFLLKLDEFTFFGQGSENIVYRKGGTCYKVPNGVDIRNSPKRAAALWKTINGVHPEVYPDILNIGWYSPWIKGEVPSDSQLKKAVLKIYKRTKHIVIDAPKAGNFIYVEKEEKTYCVDLGAALKLGPQLKIEGSQLSFSFWKEQENHYLKEFFPDYETDYPETVKAIRALLYIALNGVKLEKKDLNDDDTISDTLLKEYASKHNESIGVEFNYSIS